MPEPPIPEPAPPVSAASAEPNPDEAGPALTTATHSAAPSDAVSDEAAPPQPAAPVLTLREKHPAAARWMHWLNFPVLALMIWSGLMIYWADSDAAYLYPHRVYRVGIGGWTLFRLFPNGFYEKLGLTFSLAKGLSWHFFLMWFFTLNGVAYVIYTLVSGAWRDLLPGRGALRDAWHVVLHDLHLRREMPTQGKYNAAQQIAYTLIVLAGAGSVITGLAIYKPVQLHWLTTLLGGYEMARWLHFWLTMGYVVFFVVHVAQVAIAGWNDFRAMVAGFELVQESAVPKREQP
ncbi:MAG: thiosulfate reductase cytochrome b subunit (rane anchoring protein)-like protein [Acidobacteriaceae bacterium]|nr:thiosulfate reductase cytochrome b subunit (rane anchoring protein)-like protein [Acidobacteriaceae bacterium]